MAIKHLLEDMSFVEFGERLADDPVILLPFGSQEEQGPACPMGDWMLTREIAARVAERSGAIAAPTVPFGYADCFRPVPGGIQLRAETFVALFTDVCENFLDHGVTRLVVLNGHTGNAGLIDQASRRLKSARGVVIPCLNLWRLIPPALWEELHPGRGASALGHGSDPLTSVYRHLSPALVRDDLVAPPGAMKEFLGLPTSGLGAVMFRGMPVQVPLDVTERCDDGVAGGDPTRSTPAIGRRIVDHLVDFASAFVDHMRGIDPAREKGES